MKYILALGCIILFVSCNEKAVLLQNQLKLFESPAGESTSLPFLKVGEDNRLYLSWVREMEDQSTLYFASLIKENIWSDAQVIASGTIGL